MPDVIPTSTCMVPCLLYHPKTRSVPVKAAAITAAKQPLKMFEADPLSDNTQQCSCLTDAALLTMEKLCTPPGMTYISPSSF